MQGAEDVYRRLRRHIDRMPVGFPETESGVELRLLRHLFTPEEAEIALHLSALPEPLERIHKRVKGKGMPKEKLEETLDRLAAKGAIMGGPNFAKGREGKRYCKAQLAIGMFELQVNRLTREYAEDFFQYEREGFADEFLARKTRQMRTIPVNKSLKPEHRVAVYDDARELVERSAGPFAVLNCVCRQAKDKLGEPCRQTGIRETCVVFERFADASIAGGNGRSLSRGETMALFDRAEREGMVLQPENDGKPQFICCCCGCCCGVLTAAKRYPRPADLFHSNFFAKIRVEACTGCGKCVSRCQMGAIVAKDGAAAVDPGRCIGCGLCTTVCDANAVLFRKKPKDAVPPKDHDALYRKIMMQRLGPWGALKAMGGSILGRKI